MMATVSVVIEGPLWHPAEAQVPALAGEPERPEGAPDPLVIASKEIATDKRAVKLKRVVVLFIIWKEYELVMWKYS